MCRGLRLLPSERIREFVLSHELEAIYLEAAPQPLSDLSLLIIDTGLRVGEALAVQWTEIHLEPVAQAKFAYLRVRDGKSRYARRNVPLTAQVREMLRVRMAQSCSSLVFTRDGRRPVLNNP